MSWLGVVMIWSFALLEGVRCHLELIVFGVIPPLNHTLLLIMSCWHTHLLWNCTGKNTRYHGNLCWIIWANTPFYLFPLVSSVWGFSFPLKISFRILIWNSLENCHSSIVLFPIFVAVRASIYASQNGLTSCNAGLSTWLCGIKCLYLLVYSLYQWGKRCDCYSKSQRILHWLVCHKLLQYMHV